MGEGRSEVDVVVGACGVFSSERGWLRDLLTWAKRGGGGGGGEVVEELSEDLKGRAIMGINLGSLGKRRKRDRERQRRARGERQRRDEDKDKDG